MELEFDYASAKCRRCKRGFSQLEIPVFWFKRARGRKQRPFRTFAGALINEGNYFLSGDVTAQQAWYHYRCVPPNLKSKLAAAAPA